MELRLWNFESDGKYIPNFLEGMSIAHNEPIRTQEWFHWKFECSPYGKAIMACAFDGENVAGCVAYGRGKVLYDRKEWTCALSYETYVHPNYQGHGLFKKLILLAEQEMSKAGIQFLYNFPNSNSITGFKHMGWTCRNDIRCFKIKLLRPLNTLLHIKDLKKSFVPNPSNIQDIQKFLPINVTYEGTEEDIVTPIWDSRYLQWRFFSNPNREYFVINNDYIFSISMIGQRGKLKSAHILYSISKKDCSTQTSIKETIKELSLKVRPNIIEYASTIFDKTLDRTWGFFKVPANGNFCYKVLDNSMEIKDFKILLPSINAHTY